MVHQHEETEDALHRPAVAQDELRLGDPAVFLPPTSTAEEALDCLESESETQRKGEASISPVN